MKFIVEIELGNDAMQTNRDVSKALRQVAKEVDHQGAMFRKPTEFKIRDLNGNTVGRYETADEPKKPARDSYPSMGQNLQLLVHVATILKDRLKDQRLSELFQPEELESLHKISAWAK